MFDGKDEVDGIEFPFDGVGPYDRLPNGDWAIASGVEETLRILSREGHLVRRFDVGNSLGHLQCASDGSIWAGYWDQADGPLLGIVKFSSQGEVVWQDSAPLDCEALNVSRDRTWTYCYPELAIVDIDQDLRVRTRACGFAGATALAVDGEMALLASGYEGERGRVVLLKLHDDSVEVIEEFGLPELVEAEPGRPSLLIGRGETIHFLHHGVWHQLSVADAIQSSTSAPRS